MSRVELRKKWEVRIAEYRASGQTQTQWCEANHLKLHQFKYWLRKIENEKTHSASSSQWVPIAVNHSYEAQNPLIVKVGLASIEVQPGYDPSLLADVVRTLRSLC